MLIKHAGIQFGIALLLFTLWAAADAWYTVTGLGVATALSLLLALIAGVAIATVVHEWFHLLGAKLGGAAYRIPDKPGLFVYDYDFASNTLSQFNKMSLAGQAGSWLSVLVLAWLIPGDNPGRDMLVSAAAGAAVYAGYIELPPLRRAQVSGDPLAELSQINQGVLQRAGVVAVAAVLLLQFLSR